MNRLTNALAVRVQLFKDKGTRSRSPGSDVSRKVGLRTQPEPQT